MVFSNSSFFRSFLLGCCLLTAVSASAGKNKNKGLEKDKKKDEYVWDKIGLRENLYDRRHTELEKEKNIEKRNNKALEQLIGYQPDSVSRLNGINQSQANLLMRMMLQHPVVGAAGKAKYDPQGTLGFCFGRATWVHLELIRRGVAKDAIKKIFIVGPMKSSGIDWQFHVATAVRASDKNNWYVIDQGSTMTVDEWFKYFNQYSTDKKLRLFVTDPARLGPSSWEYNIRPGGMFDPAYNDYFKDLFRTIKTQPLPEDQKFGLRCSQVFR